MPQNAVVRARINGRIREEASAVLEAMGLTASDAFRMMMTRIATEKAPPFEPLVPNAETVAAMKEARRGNPPPFARVDDLMAGRDAELVDVSCSVAKRERAKEDNASTK